MYCHQKASQVSWEEGVRSTQEGLFYKVLIVTKYYRYVDSGRYCVWILFAVFFAFYNPSDLASLAHLPLHKGGFVGGTSYH